MLVQAYQAKLIEIGEALGMRPDAAIRKARPGMPSGWTGGGDGFGQNPCR